MDLALKHFEYEVKVDTAPRCKINFLDFSYRAQCEPPPKASRLGTGSREGWNLGDAVQFWLRGVLVSPQTVRSGAPFDVSVNVFVNRSHTVEYDPFSKSQPASRI